MRIRRKKSKRNRNIIILAASVLILIVILIAAYSGIKPWTQKDAQEYFSVESSTIDDLSSLSPDPWNHTLILITGLTFNLKAYGGDAHYVVVRDLAGSGDQDFDEILQGQVVQITMQFQQSLTSQWDEEHQGFEVTVRIRSDEAVGSLTFYIPII